MLTDEQCVEVREEFISLLRQIKREGSDIEGLIEYLDNKGFFNAPATSKYYCSFEGGLMLHSLNTYKVLNKLVTDYYPFSPEQDTILILGLLHAVYKSDLYEKISKNEKCYSKYGKSKDALGHFDWTSTLGYRVADESKRDIYGDGGFSSYFIISGFIPLTSEESVIMANFNELLSDNCSKENMFQIFSKYPLASLLLSASLTSSYCIENPQLKID